MSLPTCLVNNMVSTLSLTKLFDRRKLESLSYQALGACFKPYNALSSLKQDLDVHDPQNREVVQHKLPHQ